MAEKDIVTTTSEIEISSSSPRENKKRKKSAVWEEFDEIEINGEKKLICKHCRKKFKPQAGGSTTTLLKHLKLRCNRRPTTKDQDQKILSLNSSTFDMTMDELGSLGTYKYDREQIKNIIAKMVICHELPFRFVEGKLFNLYSKMLCPRHDGFSRITIRNECVNVYKEEKTKLRSILEKVDRVCLTTDMWTSNQTIGYMSLTGHYIDSNWVLHKQILSFCHMPPPHNGVSIATAIHDCQIDWGIEEKILSITLDNASVNDVVVKTLKETFETTNKLVLGGLVFHVRCCAHILNLIVQDGMKEIKAVVETVRRTVRHIKSTPSRKELFKSVVSKLKLSHEKGLSLDTPTRWNSTFDMLDSALVYERVFPMFNELDSHYDWLPSTEDWEKVKKVHKILKLFKRETKIFSGTSYPTANLFLTEIFPLKILIDDKLNSKFDFIQSIAKSMKVKFDKYWSACSILMSVAVVLNPRYKMRYLRYCFLKLYPVKTVNIELRNVEKSLFDIYKVYEKKDINLKNSHDVAEASTSEGILEDDFESFLKQTDDQVTTKSELDMYIDEYVVTPVKGEIFDSLGWWKQNTIKFRILSTMARDILSIPISTVASESAFSTGGRVINQYRTRMKPETIEALICTQDWLRSYYFGPSNDSDAEEMD